VSETIVTIEKLVYGGAGLARLDGRVVLTPFVLPGETARVAIASERPGMLEASLEEILAPAAGRTDPPCPFFYRCGGCHYQHAVYETQLEQKRAILAETLRRIGRIELDREIEAISGEPWGYRNRTQFHIDGTRIGYFGFGTRELVAVDRCPISSPRINQALAALTGMLRDRRWPRFVRSVEVFTNETDVQIDVRESDQPVARRFFDWCAEAIPGFAPQAIEYAGFRVSRGSFFQVNRFLTEALVDRALSGAGSQPAVVSQAAPGGPGSALDLYAGVGLFSIPLARRFARVNAVETGGTAVRDLEDNVRRAGVNVEAHQNSAESYLDNLEQAPDFVLADPPRAGLGRAAVRALLRLKPAQISIVSCDPATLGRDLQALLAGGYGLDRLTLVDLFPQTFHIESVAALTLR
jgi:23S rRNA (uracil1939-C5)-methyltransferase